MDGDSKPSAEREVAADGTSEVAHFARSAARGRPPAKAFVSKPFSARAPHPSGKPQGTLPDKLHGKGPIVKWPSGRPGAMRGNPRTTPSVSIPSKQAAATPTVTPAAATTEHKGENMSERFIAERLMSDRGTSFNPQIPRRVPDIPNLSPAKSGEADAEGKRLMIGKAVTLSGEIGGCERLVVEGQVDVTLKDVKTLEVGAQGNFKGTAAVESAIIAGTFEGALKVSGHLDVGPNAVVKGTVSYGTIAVASGGKLLGTIESAG